ncbi:MAG: homoserine dehydrogenase, partial [Nitrospira bacterium SG8_35_4]
YILTKMSDEGVSFSEALKEAQALGYAEADPTFDVEGIDSAHKLTILASLAYGIPLSMKKIYTEGISIITPMDIQFAWEFGYKIKLLAIAKRSGDQVELRVHPTMIPVDDLISSVHGVFNAIYIEGDAIDIAKNIQFGAAGKAPILSVPEKNGRSVKKMEDITTCYYLRFSALDKPGVLSKISGILGNRNISIKSMIQKGRKKEKAVPLVLMTHEARERDMTQALKEINSLRVVSGKPLRLRVEGGEA